MMDGEAARRAAQAIGEARTAGRRVGPLPADCAPQSEADGYAVQAALHQWFTESGAETLAGYKVGCTTPVMQKLLGIPNPAYGRVLSSRVFASRAEFTANAFQNPGIECEIAVRISAGTDPARQDHDRESIAEHVGACMAAMEIVDNRFGNFRATPPALMIADDFFNGACVLGSEIDGWRDLDLAAVEGRTIIDGAAVGTGTGADVMGNPLEAVAWLANALATRGGGLRAGHFVLCGSLVAVHWIEAFPAEAEVQLDGLGTVTARFG